MRTEHFIAAMEKQRDEGGRCSGEAEAGQISACGRFDFNRTQLYIHIRLSIRRDIQFQIVGIFQNVTTV